MIYNTSDFDFDFVIQQIKKAPLGVMMYKEDKKDSILVEISNKTPYDKKIELGDNIYCYIVPVKYNLRDSNNTDVECIDFALTMLYKRWCLENDKQMKNSPYNSKLFMQYMETLDCFGSDYLVIEAQESEDDIE